jgi:hypothetical protein
MKSTRLIKAHFSLVPIFSQFRGIKTTTLVRLPEQRTSVLTISLMPMALVKKDRALQG